jgi:hypothetical protein
MARGRRRPERERPVDRPVAEPVGTRQRAETDEHAGSDEHVGSDEHAGREGPVETGERFGADAVRTPVRSLAPHLGLDCDSPWPNPLR